MNGNLGRFLGLSSIALLAACAGSPALRTAGSGGAEALGVRSPGSSAHGAPMTAALAAAADRGDWRQLRIEAECQDDAAQLRSVTLFGGGVGIWHGERQFAVSREALVGLLRELARIDFGDLPESFGGSNDPDDAAPVEGFGLRLICRVRVVLDGFDKQSYQLSEGRQSHRLREIAERILDLGEGVGPRGLGADSLSDGLEKLARGELAPETLILQLQRQPEDPRSSEPGWLLRLEHGVARLSLSSREAGWSDPREVPLSREEISALAGRLAASRPEELPVNLYSPRYQDLEIRVLNRRVLLQARRFAGLTPETHGEKQARFDALVAAIEAVRNRVEEPPVTPGR